MKNNRVFRAVWLAAAMLGLTFGSNAFAAKGGSGGDLTDFVGSYSGTITFPTTLFGAGPVLNYTGPGLLVVTAKGKKASIIFMCSASAPLAVGTSVSINSKLSSTGKFTTGGNISGEPFNPASGKFKVRGKKLTSTPYSFVVPSNLTTLNWGVSYKISGKSVTATGPAVFSYFGFTSAGTFTFKGKRLAQ
ncbi:MAG: hypothetical protein ACREKL_09240 [Chthoniobacterales bacterium]